MAEYPIGAEALEATAEAYWADYRRGRTPIKPHEEKWREAINAFLVAEDFTIEETRRTGSPEYRAVGPWRKP